MSLPRYAAGKGREPAQESLPCQAEAFVSLATIPKRGYRFVVPVVTTESTAVSADTGDVALENSLAVMPFTDMSAALQVASERERLRAEKGLFAYEPGIIHAGLDDRDKAFTWFTRAVRERSGWIAYLNVDPRPDALRADRRYDRLLPNRRPVDEEKGSSRTNGGNRYRSNAGARQ